MEWSRVRKRGQVETNVSAVARGWEEFRSKFPYLGHDWRRKWSEQREVTKWLAGGGEEWLVQREEKKKMMKKKTAEWREVEKWLRGGGERE